MIRRSGFLMIELLLVVGVITGFMSFFYMKIYVPQQLALAGKKDVKNQEKIKVIIDMYIKLAAAYNINLYRAADEAGNRIIPRNFKNIEPLPGDESTKISIKFDKDIIDSNIYMKTLLLNSNCQIQGTAINGYYNYRCYGVGDEITIIKRQVDPHVLMNDIYTDNIPIFKIKKLRNGVLIGNQEFSLINTYKKLKEDSLEKINIIKKRLVSFNKTVYTNEIASPCSYEGGLDSWDDFNIPWVWKINSTARGSNRKNLCEANTSTEIKCECSNFNTDMWSNDPNKLELSVIESSTFYNNVLRNLYLPLEYRYDEVGNPIYILLFSTLLSQEPRSLTTEAPLVPKEGYKIDELGSNSSALRDIAEYRQGEIFVKPINWQMSGHQTKHFQESRITCFYD